MSNPGFQPYIDLTSNAHAAGGPVAYVAQIERDATIVALAIGIAVGAVTTVTARAALIRAKRRKAREQIVPVQ